MPNTTDITITLPESTWLSIISFLEIAQMCIDDHGDEEYNGESASCAKLRTTLEEKIS